MPKFRLKGRSRSFSRSKSRSRKSKGKRRMYRPSSSKRNVRPGRYEAVGTMFKRPRVTIQRGYLPFQGPYLARLPYDEDIVIACPNATQGTARITNTYRANSAYSPGWTVPSTAQPYGYDQLAMFYNNYRVNKVRVQATFYNPTLDGMWAGIRCRLGTATDSGPPEDPTLGMNIADLKLMPNTFMKQINDTGVQKVSFDFTVDLPTFFGMTPGRYYNETAMEAGIAGNPSYPIYPFIEPFAVFMGALSGDPTAYIRCNVKLTYHCRFFLPKQIPES